MNPVRFSLMPPFVFPDRLGDRLCRARIVSRDQLRQALARQNANGHRLGFNLVALGFLDEETLANFLSEQYRLPAVRLHWRSIDNEAVELFELDDLMRSEIIPIAHAGDTLTVAMVDPTDRALIEEMERESRLRVNPVVASQSAIRRALSKYRFKASLPESFDSETELERDQIGELLAELQDYKIVSMLGRGGFAKVYKCVQRSLDRFVAIKTLAKNMVRNEEIVKRFRLEGRIVARLNHLNIVRVIDQGEVGDVLYMVMEYVEGQSLDDYLGDKPFEEKLDVVIQLCDAIAYAHAQGVLHRDIKPSNIIVDRNGLARLLDFGIALLKAPPDENGAAKDDERLTRANIVMGTPRYMAPEQRKNLRNIDERADLYALGVILHEVFTNSAFHDETPRNPCAIDRELPAALGRIVEKCLADERDERVPSVAELKELLLRLRDQLGGEDDTIGRYLSHAVAQNREMAVKDRYTFLSELKDDARCRVILAEHKTLQRLILIKRFERKEGIEEAKILARANHKNIAEIYGVAEDGQSYVTIAEYLNGGSLRDRMSLKRQFTGEQALEHALSLAEALAFAHGFRVAHGHPHPDNVLFKGDGTLKVTDFGGPATCDAAMRRYFEHEWVSRSARARDPFAHDRFCLGVLLYEMISGRVFNPVKAPVEQAQKLRPINVYPRQLKRVVARLWNLVDDEERYGETGEVVDELRRIAAQSLGQPAPGGASSDAKAARREGALTGIARTVRGLFGK